MRVNLITFGVLWTLFYLLASSNCDKILFFMGLSSHSHRVAMQPLANKLALAGHQVTFLSPIKPPSNSNPNISEFRPKVLEDLNSRTGDKTGRLAVEERLKNPHGDPLLHGNCLWDISYNIQKSLLQDDEFQRWFNASTFNLIVVDHPTKEVAFALAYRTKAKTIAFGTGGGAIMSDGDLFGLPVESHWLPDWSVEQQSDFLPDTFFYTLNAIRWYFSYTWNYLPLLDQLVKENLGGDVPRLQDLLLAVDLHFVNEHYSIGYARSLPPHVIPIAGTHVSNESGPLVKELQEFIGNDNFIYISFGSILKMSYLPEDILNMMIQVTQELKQFKFLWKWDGNAPKGPFSNIKFQQWFPQEAILNSPKCVGFISQGGALSLQQAAYYGVPVLAIPIWGDQTYNARALAHHGSGIFLELSNLNENSFKSALEALLTNDMYAKNALKVSKSFKDRPMSALDTAYWWTEYVLRNNDTRMLKGLGVGSTTWWQRRFLDFWGYILVLLLAIVALICTAIVASIRIVRALLQMSWVTKLKRA